MILFRLCTHTHTPSLQCFLRIHFSFSLQFLHNTLGLAVLIYYLFKLFRSKNQSYPNPRELEGTQCIKFHCTRCRRVRTSANQLQMHFLNATHWNVIQCSAMQCNSMQYNAVQCNSLQLRAVVQFPHQMPCHSLVRIQTSLSQNIITVLIITMAMISSQPSWCIHEIANCHTILTSNGCLCLCLCICLCICLCHCIRIRQNASIELRSTNLGWVGRRSNLCLMF